MFLTKKTSSEKTPMPKRQRTGPQSSKKKVNVIAPRFTRPSRKVEIKSVPQHFNIPSVDVPATANVQHLSLIAQGDDVDQRDGRVVNCIRINCTGSLRVGGNTIGGAATGLFRQVIFTWHQNTVPNWLSLFQTNAVTANYNQDNNFRFRVISDKYMAVPTAQVNQGFAGAYATKDYAYSINKKINQDVNFMGPAATDYFSGAIFVMMACSQANYALFDGGFQVYFKDT